MNAVVATRVGCSLAIDAEGIAQITFDLPGKVNVMNDDFVAVMEEFVPRLEALRNSLKGVVISSAKRTFFAGGDLGLMGRARESERANLFTHFEKMKGFFRRLEKLRLPVVAEISGSALGGGLELALSCNHRIALRGGDIVLGLPEVEFGILPGAGGVVRLVALVGLDRALDYLLSGKKVDVETALRDGIIDDIAVDEAVLQDKARTWIRSNPRPLQPWDEACDIVAPDEGQQARSNHDMPWNLDDARGFAARRIFEVARQSTELDLDTALRVETEVLIDLMIRPETASLIASFFTNRQTARKGVA